MSSKTRIKGERNLSYDLIRIFACILVVLAHSPIPDATGSHGLLLSTISLSASPSIGLFFMVSGALLLPVRQNTLNFLKRRFVKLGVPTVFWSIAYLVLGIWLNGNTITAEDLLSIPFSAQGCPVLWFMYVLLGFYLICPIISPYLERIDRNEANLYLALILICFCFPIISYTVRVQTDANNILYYFYGYGGYFFIGWYLVRFPKSFSIPIMAVATLGIYLLAIWLKATKANVDFYSVFWLKSITTVIVSIFIFRTISTAYVRVSGLLGSISRRIIILVSNLTFGVFLIHFAVIRYWLWCENTILSMKPYWLQIFVIFLIATFISFAISYALSKLRIGSYLIAFYQKK